MSKPPPRTLTQRFDPRDLALFDDVERARFIDPYSGEVWEQTIERLAWELLYRKEPDLYVRLIAGETIHPAVIDRLPRAQRAVELAAGTGRLTHDLAQRCESVIAVEPARPLIERLQAGVSGNVEIRRGFFDEIPVEDACADLVVSCSAFTSDEIHGGDSGLRELERVVAPGGSIVFVWPADVDWLEARGFSYESFDGDMCVTFADVDEAIALASIFYPDAVDEIARRGNRAVPYAVLGTNNPPRDIACKTL